MTAYTTLDYLNDLRASDLKSAKDVSFVQKNLDPYWRDHMGDADAMHYLVLDSEKKDSDFYQWDFTASNFPTSTKWLALSANITKFNGFEGLTYDIFSLSYFDPSIIKIYDSTGNTIAASIDKTTLFSDYSSLKLNDFIAPYTGVYYVEAGWNQGSSSDHELVSLDIYADVDTAPSYNKNLSYELNVNPPPPNNLPTGAVEIKGSPSQYQTLTATNNLADADGLGVINYQWLKDGGVISGANKSSYVLTAADVGKSISVKASYTDKLQHSESVNSNATSVVVAVASTKPTAGDDQLTGTAKNDKLSSLEGNDTLIGGLGVDILTGGLGTDVFKFNQIKETGLTAKTRDTITDFKTSEGDKIDLSGIDANTNRAGDQAFTKLDIGAKFSGKFSSTGQLFFDTTTQILWGNVDTKAGADFSIQLNGVSSLVATDFVL
jgi:hypothetical protein